MRQASVYSALASLGARADAASLADVCTQSNVQAALPANGTLLGIQLLPASVSASPVYNASAGNSGTNAGGTGSGGDSSSSDTYSYCNVTVSYTHTGKGDTVVLHYALPAPGDFANRFYLAGGGGFSLSSSSTGGLPYGAASGATDAGYDAFSTSYDEVVLYGNGSINWDATYMFGYQALGELTRIGKPLSRAFYGLADDAKLHTYFEGCSDGGREAMSQVQRWGGEYDGVIAGAPAFRFSQQQVLHLLSSVAEHTLDHYPPPCALEKIVNATIAACDPLDGRSDGVVSRTDLCKLTFNMSSVVGEAYHCAATSGGGGSGPSSSSSSSSSGMARRQMPGGSGSDQPEQSGTVTARDVELAETIYRGIINSKGERAYLSWQVGSSLSDAATAYNNETGAWELSITSMGGEYVARFVELLDLDNLASLEGVTYDTLADWAYAGMVRYYDSLQTTQPDLTAFRASGGKLLHYHGESDPSIPAASSVHYWQAVRDIMYPGADADGEEEALRSLADWYQLYLVPGAGHCGTNSLQPGPFPQDNMAIMIDWVENGVRPAALNATVSSGAHANETQMLCQWPTRPLWKEGNSDDFSCVNDQKSIDSWTYSFDAVKIPVY